MNPQMRGRVCSDAPATRSPWPCPSVSRPRKPPARSAPKKAGAQTAFVLQCKTDDITGLGAERRVGWGQRCARADGRRKRALRCYDRPW
jgi:hypothetical protein